MTSALECTCSTRGVQENGSHCLVVHQSAERLWLIICFQYFSYASQLNNTTKPGRPGVRCMTSALECTCCTRGVHENGSIGFVVHQSAEIF